MYGYGGYNQGDHMRHDSLDFYAPADRGCALCRNGVNCSLAVHNVSAGVFCGDVLSTFQPCCCSFRNECMTTIFSDSCECFDGEREQEIMTTRFYLFVGLSAVAWALLAYDKMCAGPYKVMNSNHQLLASSPSAAQVRGEGSVVDTVDSDSDDERIDLDVDSAAVATGAAAVAVEVHQDVADEDDRATAPLRPDSSSQTAATDSSGIEVSVEASDEATHTDTERQVQDQTSIQSV
ncbi:hypothetical protein PHYBOEH_004244 [Phytophthora boehmeriae]|uniref:Uncharacterized protein n=1 Tax=Phytophthora boehmeriae TaxID=109152 RepID=A0A8T1WM67_9STRA|nr:hypothetical protein PHYBOEH_004244 [Phytophthora boehmeriae]